MFHPYILIFAYSDALKAKNIRNPSSNNITLNAINIKRIHKVSQALLTNSWQPRLTIRMLITKVNPAEYRPLTMLSSIDKIVATAMKVVFKILIKLKGSPRDFERGLAESVKLVVKPVVCIPPQNWNQGTFAP